MDALKEPCVTPEEYLERERAAETKSEYIGGEIVAMAGASRAHSLIVTNALVSLGVQLKRWQCDVYGSDMRVCVTEAGLYTYPDIVVACGDIRTLDGRNDTLLNPTVIVEILSPSTEAYDRGAKFFCYRHLESLTDFLLVSQEMMRVEHFARQPHALWLMSEAAGPDGVIEIPSIECSLRLADVYDRVRIPTSGIPGNVEQ